VQDVHATDAHGRTALWHAAAAGAEQLLEELAYAGGRLDAEDGDGASPLYAACHQGAVSRTAAALSRPS
jgi:ankyrin repeat protein